MFGLGLDLLRQVRALTLLKGLLRVMVDFGHVDAYFPARLVRMFQIERFLFDVEISAVSYRA